MMETEGCVAIVTGAAQGIGKCITKCLLSEGYQVGTNTNCMYHSVEHTFDKLNVCPLNKSLYVAAVIQRQMIGYNSARCNHIDSMCHTIRVKQ